MHFTHSEQACKLSRLKARKIAADKYFFYAKICFDSFDFFYKIMENCLKLSILVPA